MNGAHVDVMTLLLHRRALGILGVAVVVLLLGPARIRLEGALSPTFPTNAGIPTSRGNVARTGEQPGPGPARDPVSLWEAVPASGLSDPAVIGETVYVGTTRGVYALGSRRSEERWRVETIGRAGEPTVVDGTVYVGSSGGSVYALGADAGREKWRYDAVGAVSSAPVVAGGLVYAAAGVSGAGGGMIHALDRATGVPRWQFAVPPSGGQADQVTAALALGEEVLLGATLGGSLYALDADSGTLLWTFVPRDGGTMVVPPAVAAGRVFISALLPDIGNDSLYALDLGTGAELWHFARAGGNSAPAISGGIVYVGGDSLDFYAIDAETGVERWRRSGEDLGASFVVIADDLIYATTSQGDLLALDAARAGEERWRYEIGKAPYASPAVVNGVIFVGSERGLFAIGER